MMIEGTRRDAFVQELGHCKKGHYHQLSIIIKEMLSAGVIKIIIKNLSGSQDLMIELLEMKCR